MKPFASLLTLPVVISLLVVPYKSYAFGSLWSKQEGSELKNSVTSSLLRPSEIPTKYQLDFNGLKKSLNIVQQESANAEMPIMLLPVGSNSLQEFHVVESPIMEPALAASYPEIKSYKVYGIDDPNASGRLSISPKGFHGFITSPTGSFYIDPDRGQAGHQYIARKKPILSTSKSFKCGVEGHNHENPLGEFAQRYAYRTPGSHRQYRLAMAATAEYVAAVGGTKSAAMNEVVIAIDRVNQIYEVELGVQFQLVTNTDNLFYTDSATDPYTNIDGISMLSENQSNIDMVIGTGNYDIGHVFSTGGGGIASLSSVCTANKAQGVTGLVNPTGDVFYVDFVAHEIGHQFSADHTFNGTTSSCGSGRSQANAYEPGSGSTIMSYAGICNDENIQLNSNAHFHAGSIASINNFTTAGTGASCGSLISASNPSEPVIISADAEVSIPRKTPFILSVEASDADVDPLTYSWDQMNASGTATTVSTLGFDLGDNPLIRSYLPQSENKRHFPALGTTIQGLFDDSEVLGCETRALNFRAIVRDGKGGIDSADVIVNVRNDAGPFEVTSHGNTQLIAPGLETVTWNVANTSTAPINCARVDISLLTFNGGKTTYFETVLASDQSNTGNTMVNVPDKSSSLARFKIQCSDNVFYDISDADLTITGSIPFASDGNEVTYNTGGIGLMQFDNPAQICNGPVNPNTSPEITEGAFVLVNMSEDSSPTPFSLTVNATDAENDTLTWSIYSQGNIGIASVSSTPTGTSQIINYSPVDNETGGDGFVVQVSDGNLTDTIFVSVDIAAVNDPPIANDDSLILENIGSGAINVLQNDSDLDNDTLVIIGFTQGQNGSVSGVNDSLIYTPEVDFVGSDTFSYTVSDGVSGLDSATVNVQVSGGASEQSLESSSGSSGAFNVFFLLPLLLKKLLSKRN